MNMLFKALGVVVLAGLSAFGVVYMDNHCPKKQEELQNRISVAVAKYINNNSQEILENIAKNENFSDTIKNFSGISDDELKNKIRSIIEDDPALLENFVRNNAEAIALYVSDNKDENTKAEEKSENKDEQPQEDTSAKAFLEHWDELKGSDVAPAVGPKDAKVTVVEFFDFACGHCKALAPIMLQVMKNNPDVRFVFNPLFFISEHSPYAAKVAMVAAQKGKFHEVYEGIMTLPDINEDTVNQILADEGLDVEEVKKAIEEKKIRRGLQAIDSLSQVLEVNGVPMIIINGKPFYGRTVDELQSAINSFK